MLSLRAFSRRVIIIRKNCTRFNGQLRFSTIVLSDRKYQLKRKPKKEEPLNPETVGLTQFLVGPEVTGIIREEFRDFQVHEIDLNGNIIHLTDLGPPQDDKLTKNGSYETHCNLFKQGVSGNSAVKFLASNLSIPKKSIRYAGMKDKDGMTTQRISIENVPAHRLIKLTRDSQDLKLGNYFYSRDQISIGDLMGNHFKIFVRNIEPLDSSSSPSISTTTTLEKAIQNFADFGFINYFGLQRFGAPGGGVPTHIVGQTIFQHKWEEVFDYILEPKILDTKLMAHAKTLWFRDRDPLEIVQKYSSLLYQITDEANLLVGLSRLYHKGKGDLLQAFLNVSERSRQLLTFSFQSFIWNHMASFRLKKFGLKVIPGDVVRIKRKNNAKDYDFDISNGDLGPSKNFKVLTQTDVVYDKYSIYDVLLPAPGQLVPGYDNPELQNYLEQLLTEHQVNIKNITQVTDPRMKLPNGFYRHLVVKPKNVGQQIIYYDSMRFDASRLMPSDLDRINLKKCDGSDLRQPSGNDVGAILEFSLTSSSYATAALREIIMSDFY